MEGKSKGRKLYSSSSSTLQVLFTIHLLRYPSVFGPFKTYFSSLFTVYIGKLSWESVWVDSCHGFCPSSLAGYRLFVLQFESHVGASQLVTFCTLFHRPEETNFRCLHDLLQRSHVKLVLMYILMFNENSHGKQAGKVSTLCPLCRG